MVRKKGDKRKLCSRVLLKKQTLENSGRRPHRRIANTQSSTAQNPIDQTLAGVTIPLFPSEKSNRRKLERII